MKRAAAPASPAGSPLAASTVTSNACRTAQPCPASCAAVLTASACPAASSCAHGSRAGSTLAAFRPAEAPSSPIWASGRPLAAAEPPGGQVGLLGAPRARRGTLLRCFTARPATGVAPRLCRACARSGAQSLTHAAGLPAALRKPIVSSLHSACHIRGLVCASPQTFL